MWFCLRLLRFAASRLLICAAFSPLTDSQCRRRGIFNRGLWRNDLFDKHHTKMQGSLQTSARLQFSFSELPAGCDRCTTLCVKYDIVKQHGSTQQKKNGNLRARLQLTAISFQRVSQRARHVVGAAPCSFRSCSESWTVAPADGENAPKPQRDEVCLAFCSNSSLKQNYFFPSDPICSWKCAVLSSTTVPASSSKFLLGKGLQSLEDLIHRFQSMSVSVRELRRGRGCAPLLTNRKPSDVTFSVTGEHLSENDTKENLPWHCVHPCIGVRQRFWAPFGAVTLTSR